MVNYGHNTYRSNAASYLTFAKYTIARQDKDGSRQCLSTPIASYRVAPSSMLLLLRNPGRWWTLLRNPGRLMTHNISRIIAPNHVVFLCCAPKKRDSCWAFSESFVPLQEWSNRWCRQRQRATNNLKFDHADARRTTRFWCNRYRLRRTDESRLEACVRVPTFGKSGLLNVVACFDTLHKWCDATITKTAFP